MIEKITKDFTERGGGTGKNYNRGLPSSWGTETGNALLRRINSKEDNDFTRGWGKMSARRDIRGSGRGVDGAKVWKTRKGFTP